MTTPEPASTAGAAVSAAPLLTAPASMRDARELKAYAPLAFLALLIVMMYWHVAVKLVHDWYTIPDFSHGFLIPFFVAYVIWVRREQIRATRLEPTWAGVPVVALGLVTLLIGVYGAELFLSRTSLVILLIGLVWTFAGAGMLRLLAFPLAVLMLAVPFPAIVFNRITFPLQLFASHIAAGLLPYFGVPVLRDGNVIQLAEMKLEVAEACSGIRSLMTLFTVAVIYGYFMEKSVKKRWLLALAALPIAVAANVVRIVGTGLCVQYWNPDKAEGFFHEFSGWLMFVVSMICLYVLHQLMSVHWGRRRNGVRA